MSPSSQEEPRAERLTNAGPGTARAALLDVRGLADTPALDTKGPRDLRLTASATRIPTMRDVARLQRTRPYPPDLLAADVLRGVARNRAIIVSPRSVLPVWWMWRLAPLHGLRLALNLTRQSRRMVNEAP